MFGSRRARPWSYPRWLAICFAIAVVLLVAHPGLGIAVGAAPAQIVVTASGPGTLDPGTGSYPAGPLTLTATPQPGALFTGWRVDGTVVGWNPTLSLTGTGPRTVEARFAARPAFSDVAPSAAAWDAITQLAARGIINGYGDGTYGPPDNVQRAQIAALIVRALGFDGGMPAGPAPFSDLSSVDPELQRAIMILAQRGIAKGYGDGTYDPTGEVTHAQVISLIARSMVQAGYWTPVTAAEDDGAVYPNVPRTSDHRLDLLTFVEYAGGIIDRPTNRAWQDWEGPASRGWTAQVLWPALDRYFMTNRVPSTSPTPSPSPSPTASPSPSPTASPSPSPMNNPPVAIADSYATTAGTLLSVPAPGVLGNDSDPDGNPLVAVPVAGPTHGALLLNANGSFTYTPSGGYSGPDSFTYQARDSGNALSAVTTVSLTVTPPVVPAPTITSVSPPSGPTGGGTVVVIVGTNLTGTSALNFGTTAASFVVDSATQITATTPPGGAGSVNVTLLTPGGLASATNAYTYLAPPTITGINPTSGPETGGTSVTIGGSGFLSATAVTFGSTPASFAVQSDTQITATTPGGTVGAVDVTVTTPGGTATLTNAYTYFAVPTVSSINQNNGPTTGGTLVTINGTNFTGATAVNFGGTQITAFTLNSDSSISVTTPAQTPGAVNVTVTTPGGTSNPATYTYIAPPTIAGLNPTSGSTSGGTLVMIGGTNFTGVTAVTFGGTSAASFTVISSTQIAATSPAHAPGTVDVTVTTPGGTSNPAVTYTYTSPRTITSITPNNGSVLGGTSVTIFGTGLINTTAVTFGGLSATAVTVVNDTQINAKTPSHGPGLVDVAVTTPGETIVAANAYTYLCVAMLSGAAAPPACGLASVADPSANAPSTPSKVAAGAVMRPVVIATALNFSPSTMPHFRIVARRDERFPGIS